MDPIKVPKNFNTKLKISQGSYIATFPITAVRKFIDRQIKTPLVMNFLEEEYRTTIEKYKNYKNTSNTIGNTVWTMWWQGFDDPNIPPVVAKCHETLKKIQGIELISLSRSNIEDYFHFSAPVRKAFNDGRIKVQLLSDIIRNQLLSERGGFWVDATIFVIDPNFFKDHFSDRYFTTKMPSASTSHFSKGLWSGWLQAGARGNIINTFINELFELYLEKYQTNFDYFLIDYFTMLGYENIDSIKKLIDSIPIENQTPYLLWESFNKRFNQKKWNWIMQNNRIQKLVWKTKEKRESFLEHFLNT